MPEITEAIGGWWRKLLPSHLKNHFKPITTVVLRFPQCRVSLFTGQILKKKMVSEEEWRDRGFRVI